MSVQNLNGMNNPAQPTMVGASARGAVYATAGVVGLSSLIPVGMLARQGRDIFRKEGGQVTSTVWKTLIKNPWTALTAVGLAGAGAKLASKDSVNSQLTLGERCKALSQGVGTSAVASVTEIGTALSGFGLFTAGKKAFQEEGGKVLPTVVNVLKKNPVSAAAFAGLAAASFWLEKQSSRFSDKAISGKPSA